MLTFRTAAQADFPSLLQGYIKQQLVAQRCELVFAWRSDNSPRWYKRNGFAEAEDFMQCVLCGE